MTHHRMIKIATATTVSSECLQGESVCGQLHLEEEAS